MNRIKGKWYWTCNAGDANHGCWHADYDGHCTARSRKGYSTSDLADRAGSKHSCRFGSNIHVFKHGAISQRRITRKVRKVRTVNTAQNEEADKRRRAILYIVKASTTPVSMSYIAHCLELGRTAPGKSTQNPSYPQNDKLLQRDLYNMQRSGSLKRLNFRDASNNSAKANRVLWVETRNPTKMTFK